MTLAELDLFSAAAYCDFVLAREELEPLRSLFILAGF